MKKSVIHRLIINLLGKIGIIQTVEVDKSVMCRKAVEGDACPNCGEQCAWSESLGE